MGSILTTPCTSDARLDGKIAVITGANTGIGKVTAKDFYTRGASVIIACRNVDKAKEAIEDIKQQCQGQEKLGELKAVKLDLSSLKSVRACAEELLRTESKINLLINNAGVMGVPLSRTDDGFEMTFGTNHLGHYLFTLLLMPKLIESAPGVRIVNVSSMLHMMTCVGLHFDDLNFVKRKYNANKAYIESKLANVLFTKELSRKLKENDVEGVNLYSLHPGVVRTDLSRSYEETYMAGTRFLVHTARDIFFKTPEQGSQTQIYCAVDDKCANETGLYYAECKPTEPSKAAKDEEMAKKLWDMSWKLVGLDDNYNPFRPTESAHL